MGLFQKYAELTYDEVYQAYIDVARENNSHHAIELKNELEHRKAHGESPSVRNDSDIPDIDAVLQGQVQPELLTLPLQFSGKTSEYFRIWIVNLCLTLVTFGLFSAWAKVRKKRYFYSHTLIADTPFQYLGQPIPILKGRLVAVAGFGLYYISSHFVTSLLPFVLAAGLVAAPWVLVRSAAFNARYSAFRNMTFHLDAGYVDAAKAIYAGGIVPAFVIAMIFDGFNQPVILTIVTIGFGISFPWLICRLKRFIVTHTSFGGIKGEFTARGGQFFAIYFKSALIGIAASIPISFIIVLFVYTLSSNMWFVTYLVAVPMYAGYVLGFAFVRARSTNLVWGHTRLGPLRFQSTLAFKDLAGLYLTNALGIIASCGLAIPWAVMRTLKYRVAHLSVQQDGSLARFAGSDRAEVEAIGAETLDIFDWDFSL